MKEARKDARTALHPIHFHLSIWGIRQSYTLGVDLDKVFTDKASGKDTARPQLQAAFDYLRDGDLFLVHSMDRLARNLDDLRKVVLDLTRKGVHVQFVKENLTFTGEDSPISNLLLSLLGAVAEFERSMIRERQREGIALAKKAGVYKGRKPSLTRIQIAEIRKRAGNWGEEDRPGRGIRNFAADTVFGTRLKMCSETCMIRQPQRSIRQRTTTT